MVLLYFINIYYFLLYKSKDYTTNRRKIDEKNFKNILFTRIKFSNTLCMFRPTGNIYAHGITHNLSCSSSLAHNMAL